MHKASLQQSCESVGRLGRINQRLQEDGDQALNLRVADDLAEHLETLIRS